jgi:hypothetical protein
MGGAAQGQGAAQQQHAPHATRAGAAARDPAPPHPPPARPCQAASAQRGPAARAFPASKALRAAKKLAYYVVVALSGRWPGAAGRAVTRPLWPVYMRAATPAVLAHGHRLVVRGRDCFSPPGPRHEWRTEHGARWHLAGDSARIRSHTGTPQYRTHLETREPFVVVQSCCFRDHPSFPTASHETKFRPGVSDEAATAANPVATRILFRPRTSASRQRHAPCWRCGDALGFGSHRAPPPPQGQCPPPPPISPAPPCPGPLRPRHSASTQTRRRRRLPPARRRWTEPHAMMQPRRPGVHAPVSRRSHTAGRDRSN